MAKGSPDVRRGTDAGRGPWALVLVELAAISLLHHLGGRGWSDLPTDATELLTGDVTDLVAAGTRLVALGMAWWCLLTTLAALVAARFGTADQRRRTLRLVPGFLRHHLERAVVAATAAGALLAPTAAGATPPPPALAPPEVTTADVIAPGDGNRPGRERVPSSTPGPSTPAGPDDTVRPGPAPTTSPTTTPSTTPTVPPPPGATRPAPVEHPSDDLVVPPSRIPPTATPAATPTPSPTSPPDGEPAQTADVDPSAPIATQVEDVDPSPRPSDDPPAATAATTSTGRVPDVLRGRREAVGQPGTTAVRAHVVAPGEHLWSIARDDLVDAGLPTDDPAIAAHWRRVVDLNRDRLGGDPDLVRPGQVVDLPTVGRS